MGRTPPHGGVKGTKRKRCVCKQGPERGRREGRGARQTGHAAHIQKSAAAATLSCLRKRGRQGQESARALKQEQQGEARKDKGRVSTENEERRGRGEL